VTHSILDVARELIDSPEAKAAYADDPAGFMAARGLDDLSDAEIEEAVGFVAEAMPAPVARQLVAPPGPVADSLPLARVAAATSMDVAVIEAEPGTVDLAALADPSGRLDLPTDLAAADAGEPAPRDPAPDVEAEIEEAVADPVDESSLSEGTEAGDGDFGTGAGDNAAQPRLIPDEGDEPDDNAFETASDDSAIGTPEPLLDHDDGVESPPLDVADASGETEEPPDDDFDDVVI
jgi:hypothetical protein